MTRPNPIFSYQVSAYPHPPFPPFLENQANSLAFPLLLILLQRRIMSATHMPDPPSASIINLTIADLVIYAVLLFPVIRITWKHGKSGMVCWPIFLSFFALRFVSDAYLIANRHKPQIPNPVVIMTNAGSIACMSLTIVGVIYEVYVAPSSNVNRVCY